MTTQTQPGDTERQVRPNERRLDLGDQQRNEDLRRRQSLLREQLGLDDAQRGQQGTPRGRSSEAAERGRSSLPGGRDPLGDMRSDSNGGELRRRLNDGDASALQNRQLRGRGEDNRPQAAPFRGRASNREAFRPRGQFGGDAAQRSLQAQQQEALRRQAEQLRRPDERQRNNNLEQLLNQQRPEAGRERGRAADRQPTDRQPFGRGRTEMDLSRGGRDERSPFGGSRQPGSDTRSRAFGPFPGRQTERQVPDLGRQGAQRGDDRRQALRQLSRERGGGQTPGFDPRSRMQRGGGGRPDSDVRSQIRPEARSPFGDRGGRGGGSDRPDVSRQLNRSGGRDVAPQREQSPSREAMSRGGRGGGGEDRRGGGGGRRGREQRDRDDDD